MESSSKRTTVIVAALIVCVFAAIVLGICITKNADNDEVDSIWPYNQWFQDYAGYGEISPEFDEMIKGAVVYIYWCQSRLDGSNHKKLSSFDTDNTAVSDCEEFYELIEETANREYLLTLPEEEQKQFLALKYVVSALNSEIKAKDLLMAAGVKNNEEWFDNFEKLLLEIEAYMDSGGYMTGAELPNA